MRTVLMIDDSKDIRSKYGKLFKKEGFTVFEADDALSAAEMLMKHKSDIELILLDIQMPDIDGRGIYDIIMEYTPQIPIVVWSVLPINDQKLRIPRARGYCQKSSNSKEVLQKLKEILN